MRDKKNPEWPLSAVDDLDTKNCRTAGFYAVLGDGGGGFRRRVIRRRESE